jgi:hypothetical protein
MSYRAENLQKMAPMGLGMQAQSDSRIASQLTVVAHRDGENHCVDLRTWLCNKANG